VEKYKDQVDFCIVYISEAHPADGWDMESTFGFAKQKSLEERISNAKSITAYDVGCPIYVDNFKNEMDHFFNASPERIFVLKDKKIAWNCKWPMNYDILGLENWVEGFVSENTEYFE